MNEVFVAKPEIELIAYEHGEEAAVFKEIFANLSQKDVSQFVEKKQGLSYLPWSDCYNILVTEYPSTQYHIYWFPSSDGQWHKYCPEIVGYSIQVGITIRGIHKFIPLPIWSGRPPKAVEHPDSMDVNTAIQRCGVKAAAMFGLALYLYQGEDLPVEKAVLPRLQEPAGQEAPALNQAITTSQVKVIKDLADEGRINNYLKNKGYNVLKDMTYHEAQGIIQTLKAND